MIKHAAYICSACGVLLVRSINDERLPPPMGPGEEPAFEDQRQDLRGCGLVWAASTGVPSPCDGDLIHAGWLGGEGV